ncbi:zinc-binding dehydrogenase [Candidatus Woesearchaeota archaeon]|nr:zinc-binding dehydrogenase [Candidatus Woesearchaeota archaeon]
MKTKAAVLVETGKPLELLEIEIPSLKPGQVLVDIAFSGICHTQILECRGYRGEDKYLPHCLGHEGSGVVREVGEGVTKVKPGDKVILSWMKGSGADVPGTVYGWGENKVNSGGITTFSRQSVISENRLTAIDKDIPMEEAAMLGCAAATGLGSVLNVARPSQGQSLAVFGIGGIGLCAVAGAVIAGCSKVIAVDINEEKFKLAKEMGATHLINAAKSNPAMEINKICPNLDFAVESSGVPDVMAQALESVRNQGGTAVIIGNARYGEKLCIDPRQLNMGKRLFGTWGGDNVPDKHFPYYMELISSGRLNLKPLMKKYNLEDINKAIDDLEEGKAIRPLVDMELTDKK